MQTDVPVPQPDCRNIGKGPPDTPDVIKAKVALSQDALVAQNPNGEPERRKQWEDRMKTDFNALKMSLVFVEETTCRLTADLAQGGGDNDWGAAKRQAVKLLMKARKFLWKEARHHNLKFPGRIPWYIKALGGMAETVKGLLRF